MRVAMGISFPTETEPETQCNLQFSRKVRYIYLFKTTSMASDTSQLDMGIRPAICGTSRPTDPVQKNVEPTG